MASPPEMRHFEQLERGGGISADLAIEVVEGPSNQSVNGAPTAAKQIGDYPCKEEKMSRKHWLATYGEKIPCEINPNAHGSVLAMLETAMQRFAERPAFRCFGHTLSY